VMVTMVTAVLTEVMSNTATATVILPVLLDMAISLKIHPLYFMLPSAILSSLAFMFPIGTPPNAIVYQTGKVTTWDMLKPGIVMKLFSMVVQFAMLYTLGTVLFGLNTFPGAANEGDFTSDENSTLLENLLHNVTVPVS